MYAVVWKIKQQNTQQLQQNTQRKIRKIIYKELLINLKLFKCVHVQNQDFRIAQKTVTSDFPFSREMGATAYTLIPENMYLWNRTKYIQLSMIM